MLDDTQLASYRRDGYLALPGFKTAAELAAAIARARALVAGPEAAPLAGRFSTRDRALVDDAALLASAHAVHAFYEEEAFDAQGRFCVLREQAINKIAHALHVLDPVFAPFSRGPALAALAAALGLRRPQQRQSMLIFKQPRIGGVVDWHQDASFFVTEPHSVTTFWFALEDATLDNGCLWVEPGGHRGARGVLREQYVCEQGRMHMRKLSDLPWPDARQAVPLPVAAGTLVVFDGLLPHYSAPNRSERSRLAYTLHVTDGECGYAAQNWLQPLPGQAPPGLD